MALAYSKTSGAELIESRVEIPYAVTNFNATIDSAGAIVSTWQIAQKDGAIDPAKLPFRTQLTSVPSLCSTVSGDVEIVQTPQVSTIVSLDANEMTTGILTTSRDEFLSLYFAEPAASNYVDCTFDLQLRASWRLNWDGIDAPTTIDGSPVWIQPNSSFANEGLPLRERSVFEIEVMSEIQRIKVRL